MTATGPAGPPLFHPEEMAFQLYDVLDVLALTSRPRFAEHSRQTFDPALETARAIALAEFRPHSRRSDLHEPHLADGRVVIIPEVGRAIRVFAESGLMAAHHDFDLGGMQLPWTVAQACHAHFHAANVATFAYCFLTIAAANLLRTFGTPGQRARYLEDMLSGRCLGTMCLSEPGAGSSLGDLLTRAEPTGDGHYRITGSKMWISGGEHELTPNIAHLVLARIAGAPAGAKGISLFLVPRLLAYEGRGTRSNGVTVSGLNHKMGYRGTVNTVLAFGEREPCIGELVGTENRGLAHMFHMMNEARVVVGMSAAALGCAGYQVSLAYAFERRQGRLPQAKGPDTLAVAIVEHADVRRLLLEQRVYAEGALALALYCARLLDDQQTAPEPAQQVRAGALLDVLTPVVKAWSADWCVKANSNAIQVLGGYGYTRDFPVEQLFRDNRLNPIHEGTNGIQAIDLVGRKLLQDGGEPLRLLLLTMRADIAEAAREPALAALARALADAAVAVEQTTAAMLDARECDGPAAYLADASLYLDFLGHAVIAWMWLRQAAAAHRRIVADPASADFLRGKLAAARFFFARELPSNEWRARLLRTADDTCRTLRNEWF